MCYQQWQLFERAYAVRSPAIEAEYAHDERTALGLYDCLIPNLRDYRKRKVTASYFTSSDIIDDIKARQRVLELELKLETKRSAPIAAECRNLVYKVDKLERENSIINWIVRAAEHDFNLKAEQITDNYEQLQKDHSELIRKST